MGISTATIKTNEQFFSINPEKPWFDQNNRPFSDDVLKDVSKNWDAEIWEQYLKWCEKPQYESLIHHRAYNCMTEKLEESVFLSSPIHPDIEKKKKITEMLSCLTYRQKNILEMIYWKQMSEQAIAKQTGISRSGVRELKSRAIRKLKKTFKRK